MESDTITDAVETKAVKKRFYNKITFAIIILALGAFLGALHYHYVSTLFEKDVSFSYLSTLEREMVLRTEMGFYYSYYKTMVTESQFVVALRKIMYDKMVEHPTAVNAINRFNIYPEMLIGALYRYIGPRLNDTRECHIVSRGSHMAPVESCTGIGEPVYFYLEVVWWLAAVTVSSIFFYAVSLSGSILGGLVAVIQYFANHVECTRVMWTPNERENFAQPFLVLQMWCTTMLLRDGDRNSMMGTKAMLFCMNFISILFWQFTQFIFLTQLAIVFVMEQLRIIETKTLCTFLYGHFCGLHLAVLILQGNDMLKSSIFASFFIMVSVYSLFFSYVKLNVRSRFDLILEMWLVIIRILLVITSSLYLRKLLCSNLGLYEDTHIFDILYSKFGSYRNFHTLLYTCAAVFDFLPFIVFVKLSFTGLVPLVVFGVINVVYYWMLCALKRVQEIKLKKAAHVEREREKLKRDVKDEESVGAEKGNINRRGDDVELKPDDDAKDSVGSVEEKDKSEECGDNDKLKCDDLKVGESVDSEIGKDISDVCDIKNKSVDIVVGKSEAKGNGNNNDLGVARKIVATQSESDNKVVIETKDVNDNDADRTENTEKRVEEHINGNDDHDGKTEETVVDAGDKSGNGVDKDDESPERSRIEESEKKDDEDVKESELKEVDYDDWVLFLRNLNIDAGIFYSVSQMVVFTAMAVLVMRLKLLMTPQLCIISALAANQKYYSNALKKRKALFFSCGVILLTIFVNSAIECIKQELSYAGEFSDEPMEGLINWINSDTSPKSVFAGPMPLMATVMLTTRRAIVNHPHYEHEDSRQRNYQVYKTYGRFDPGELYRELTKLQVTYLIVDKNFCYRSRGKGCSYSEIWDQEAPSLKRNPKLCQRLLMEDLEHFYPVFDNANFKVFKIHDYIIKYMPQLYDT